MISLWVFLSEADVEAYASSLVLPDYLAHLALAPFRFSQQASNTDGQQPLRLTYCGDGRLEEFLLQPDAHVLAMIRSVCPGIKSSKIHLPQDDARWHWQTAQEPAPRMRIYFEPATRSLYRSGARPPLPEAYVSVTRGHVFVGRPAVESYLNAWLESLGIDHSATEFTFDTPSGGVQFSSGAVGGQMFLSDQLMAEELIRFAGMDTALTHVSDWAELNLDSLPQNGSRVSEDGVYIQLAKPEERGEQGPGIRD